MFHQYYAAGLAELSGDNISNVGIFKRFEPIYVAGHRMCKTRLKMMVSCGRRTHTTQLHPTGHDRDDDVDREEDDDDKDYDDDDDDDSNKNEDGLMRPPHSISNSISMF